MALVLDIVYGSTTINLNDNGCTVCWETYAPKVGKGETVTESVELILVGDDIVAIIAAIETAFTVARRTQAEGIGERVYAYILPHGYTNDRRSEIIDGKVDLDNKALSWIERHQHARAKIAWTRTNYWEDADELQLALENSSVVTPTTNPLVIYNHADAGAGHDFSAAIPADEMEGDLPTPAVIEIANSTNNASLVDDIYVGHLAPRANYNPPAVTALVFEGSGSADANCSGGEYANLPWTDDAENQLETWSIDVHQYRAHTFKILARFRAGFAYTDLWLQVRLLSGSELLSETRWNLMTASEVLQTIGNLKIPPYLHRGYVDTGQLTLALYEKRAAGAGEINLDYLAGLPLDSWRHYRAISGLAYGETLVDRPDDTALITEYVDGGSTVNKVTHLVEEGEPVMLQPGVENVLYFLHNLTGGTAPIVRTSTIQVSYRPRRQTL